MTPRRGARCDCPSVPPAEHLVGGGRSESLHRHSGLPGDHGQRLLADDMAGEDAGDRHDDTSRGERAGESLNGIASVDCFTLWKWETHEIHIIVNTSCGIQTCNLSLSESRSL